MWFPESIYTIDILFAVFVVIFVVSGIRHGLSGELAHLITLIVLLVSFCFFYPQLTHLAADYWRVLPPTAVRIIVPLVLVLLSVLIFVLVRALFKQALKEKMGESADKVFGGTTGMLRGIVVGLAVFSGLSLIPSDTLYRMLSEQSSIGGWVCNTFTPWLQPRIMELPVVKDNAKATLNEIIQ